MKALIVGPGNVGQELSKVLTNHGSEHEFFAKHNDLDSFTRSVQPVDIVFVTISTKDKGEAELSYLMRCIELGRPVVTCAKGALAWHFETLKPHLGTIGFTTTVGGGSEILPLAVGNASDPITNLRAIQNGTVNFLCWGLQGGMEDEASVLTEAQRRKLPEPGAIGLKKIFDSESRDMWMKASITYNMTGLNGTVSPDNFNVSLMEEGVIRNLLRKPGNRFALEIREEPKFSFFSDEPFSLRRGSWHVLGSFVQDAHNVFPGLSIHEESNAIIVERRLSGTNKKSGLGAGSKPTAETMFFVDAKRLLKAD